MKKIYLFLLLICCVASAQGARIYTPNTVNAMSAGATYCLSATASLMTFTYNTCNAGTGTSSGVSITRRWYYNTTNTNVVTPGTTVLVDSTVATTPLTATGTATYRPVTTASSSRYYFCRITWTGTGTCNTTGTLTSATCLITAIAAPSAISGATAVCIGSSTTFTNTVANGNWTSSLATRASVDPVNGVVYGLTAGAATITYATGCAPNQTKAITVNAVPNAIGGATTVCSGSTATATCSTTGGVWSSSNTAIASISTTGVVFGVAGGTVTLSYTKTGCSSTRSFTVYQTPTAITGPANVCTGASGAVTLSDTVTGGTWTRTNGTGTLTINSSTGVVTATAAGTATITYTTGTTCRVTRAMTINTTPATITGTPTTICAGITTTYATTTTGGVWSSSSNTLATVTTGGVVTGVAAGTPSISYTKAGCSSTKVVTVKTAPGPITGTPSACVGVADTLRNAVAGGSWSRVNGTGTGTINSTNGRFVGSAAGSVTITYAITTTGTTCRATLPFTVNVTPTAITGSTYVCQAATTTLANTVSGGTWTSSIPARASIVSSSGVATGGATAGNTTISYTIGTCGVAKTLTNRLNPVAITGPVAVCAGTSVTYTNTAANGTWSLSNTTVASVNPTTGVLFAITPGTDTLTFNNTCGTPTIKVISVSTGLPAITGSSLVCTGSTTTLAIATTGGTWSSSATATASITTGGVLRGVSTGNVTVSYTLSGCTQTKSVNVSTTPATITGASTTCVGGFDTLSNTSPFGTWSSTNTSVATVDTAGIISALSAGTTTISYATGCGTAATNSYTVATTPAPYTGLGLDSVCRGASIVFSNAVGGGTWTSDVNAIASVTSGTAVGRSAGIANISYSIGTCRTVYPLEVVATPSAIIGTLPICTGSATTLVDTTAGGLWFTSDTLKAIIDPFTGAINILDSGIVTIYYSNGYCSASITDTLYIQPDSIINGVVAICVGSADTLTNITNGGVWITSNSAIASVNATTGVVTGVATGGATITYAIGSCFASALQNVNVTPTPITAGSAFCTSLTTSLFDTTLGGLWATSNAAVASIDTDGVVYNIAAGNAIITYAIGACTDTLVVNVYNNPGAISGTSTFCQGTSSTLTNTVGSGAWSSSDPSIASINSSTGSTRGVAGGQAIITYAIGACTAIDTVIINPLAVVGAIYGPTSICNGDAAFLANDTLGGSWASSATGVATVDASGVATSVSVGTTIITYSFTNGCSTATDTALLTVNSIPVPTFTSAPSAGCVGSAATYTTQTGQTSYIWSVPGTAGVDYNITAGGIGATDNTVTLTWLTAGSKTVTATYTSAAGCAAATNATVTTTVNTLPTVAITPVAATICRGGTTNMTASGATSYTWSPSAGLSATTGATVTFNRTVTSTYTVTGNSTGCTADATQTITVNPIPTVNVTAVATTICIGSTTNMTASGATTYSWAPSAGLSASTGATVTFSGTSSTIYTVTGTTSGCNGTYQQTITVSTIPTITVTPGSSTICNGATLAASGSSVYTWSPSTGLSASTGTTVTTTATTTVTYTITGTNGVCTSSPITRTYTVTPQPTVTSVSPLKGYTPSSVTISGTNFNSTPGRNIVWFGATRATISSGSSTSLSVTAPIGATYMPVSVTDSATGCGLSGYAQYPYLPTFDTTPYQRGIVNLDSRTNFTTATSPNFVAIGDLDGDGKADLVVTNSSSNSVSVFRNTSSSGTISSGSFATKVDFTTGTAPYSVAIGDLDGDGKADLAVANNSGNSISVLRNTSSSGSISSGSFATRVDFTTGTSPFSVAIGDLDGDGKADLAVAHSSSNFESVFRNTSSRGSISSGSFATRVDIPLLTTVAYSVAIGDLDGDGKADLAFATNSNSVAVYRNTSTSGIINSGSFATNVDFTTGTSAQSVAIGDMDGDGKAELVVSNFNSNSVSVLRNTSSSGSISSGSFATRVDFTTGTGPYSVAIGDLDGDGKADLVTTNRSSNNLSVFRNTSSSGSISSGSFATSVSFTTGTTPLSTAIGDLDGDGKADLAVVNLGSNSVSVLRNNPLYSILGAGSICTGSTRTLTDSTTGGTWSSSAPGIATISTTGVVTGISSGTAIITYAVAGGSDTALVTVNTTPTVTVVPVASTICSGSTTNMTASGATTYTWSPSTGLSASTGATVTFSGAATATYTVTGTSTGCSGTATQTITVNPTPTVTVTPVSSTICRGGTTNMTAGGATTYTWAPAAGLSASTGATVTFSGTATASYTVTGTTTGCSSTANQTITVNPIPTVTATPVTSAICTGSSTNITASGATTYTWSPSTGLSASTGATVTFSGTATATYTVTGTSTGCSGTATQTITVNPTPTVTVTPVASTICFSNTTNMTASGATTYTWSPSAGLSASTGATVTFSGLTTSTYTVTGTSTGCSGIRTQTITVNTTPTVTVTPVASTICSGSNTNMTASSATSYTWSPAAGLSASTGATVTFSGTATATYTVTGTSTGCSGTATQTITVNPTPTVTVTPVASTICSGSTTNMPASGATTYTWAPAAGLSASTGATVTFSGLTTSTYTVTGTTTGCSGTRTQTITVNPTPTVTVTPVASTICSGSTTNMTASGATTYTWAPAAGLSATTGATVTFSGLTTSTYTVTGTTTGCSGTRTQTITVNTTPTVTITPVSSTICRGGTTNLTAGGATTYTWAPAAGLSASTGATVTFSGTATASYTVTGTTTGCSSTANQTITVNPIPTVTVTPVASTICRGSNTNITASGATTYTWVPAAGLSASTGATVTFSGTTTATYTVTGTTTGCSSTANQTITVNPIPTVTAIPVSSAICTGSSTNITASGAANYTWSPSTGLSASTGATVTFSGTTTTTYTVTGTTGGCSATATQTITVGTSFPVVAAISGGTSVGLADTIRLNNATAGGSWTSATPAVLAVDAAGVVTGLTAGSGTISYTVTSSGCSTSVTKAVSAVGFSDIVVTIAGTGVAGYSGDGASATGAKLNNPHSVYVDPVGNIYVADGNNHVVRKITTLGVISTFAGTGTSGFSGDGGPATAATFMRPHGITSDNRGTIYVADWDNHRIRKISPSGIVTTVCGTGTASSTGDGGPATAATINNPTTMVFDSVGNLYIGDYTGRKVRKIDTFGIITTIGGTGASSFSGDGGPATAASFYPAWLAIDRSGNLFVADFPNQRVRKIAPSGTITTVVGNGTRANAGDGGLATAASVNDPIGVFIDPSGNLLVNCDSGNIVRKVGVTGYITTIAGTGASGFSGDNGPATAATFFRPRTTVTDLAGNLVISDLYNQRIRRINKCVLPVVGAISGTSAICLGSSTAFTDTSAGGVWTSSAPGIASVSSSGTVYGLSGGSAVITYTKTNACGSGGDTKVITIDAPASVTIGSVLPSITAGTTDTFTVPTPGGTWSSSATGLATVSSSGVVYALLAGSPIITYSIINSCGTYTDTAIANVAPVAGTIAGTQWLGSGNSTTTATDTSNFATVPASSAPGASVIRVSQWRRRGINGNTGTATYNSSGWATAAAADSSKYAYFTITNNATTEAKLTAIILRSQVSSGTGKAQFAYSYNGSDTTYFGAPVTVAASIATYTVTGNACIAPGTTVTFRMFGYGLAAGTTSMRISDSTGLTMNYFTSVAAYSAAASTSNSPVCSGGTVNLTGGAPSGGISPYTYSWSGPSLASSTSRTPSIASATTGATGTYTYRVADNNGCYVSNTAAVTVNATPTVTVTPVASTICSSNTTNMTASGAASYTWSPSTGLSASTGATVTFSGLSTSTYTVTGTTTGCSGTRTQTITVNPTPTVTVTPVASTICSGNTTNMTASGATTYTWAPAAGLSASTGATVTFSGTATATYTVTGTSTGCSATASQTITVNPTPTVTVTPVASTICSGNTTNMTASGAASYTWSPSAGLSASTGATVTFNGLSTTTYTVTGTTTGCSGTRTQTIAVNPTPTVTVTPASSSAAAGGPVSLTASGATTYSWSPAATLSASTGATVSATPTITTTYTVTGTTTGCTATATGLVNVNAGVKITAVSPLTAKPGDSVTITGTGFNTTLTNNKVYFGAVKAIPGSGSSTTLKVAMPYGAFYGPISVTDTTNGTTGISGQNSGSPIVAFLPTFDTVGFRIDTINLKGGVDFTVTSLTGSKPLGAAIGDLNGDGKADLVSANSDSSTVSIFLNNTSGGTISASSFTLFTKITLAGKPNNVKLADLDGDGKLDIVAALSNNTSINVIRNTTSSPSTTSFAARINVAAGNASAVAAVADFNGDGRVDVAVSLPSAGLSILRNTSSVGSISFAAAVNATTGSVPSGVCVADFDGDGLPDLASANSGFTGSAYAGASASLFRNTSTLSTISFASATTLTTGSGPIDVAAGDVDGDGKMDVFVTNINDATFSVFRNQSSSGSFSFAARANFAAGTGATGISLADLNGDGKVDVVVSNALASTLSALRNTTSGTTPTFAAAINRSTGSLPSTVTTGDLDGDGYSDVVVGLQGSNKITVFENYPLPNLNPIAGISSICLGGTASYTNGVSGGTWSVSNTSLATINSGGLLTSLAAGIDTVWYTKVINGDTNAVALSLTVSPTPTVTVIPVTAAICRGTSTNMTASGAATYTWSPATGLSSSTGATVTFSGTSTATYTVTGTSAAGCAGTGVQTITVNTVPTVLATPSAAAICYGSGTTITASGAATYSWTPATGLSATTGASITASPTTTTTYTVTGTTGAACTASAMSTITVNPLPGVPGAIVGGGNVCIGNTIAFTDTSVTGAWSTSDASVATINSSGLATALTAGTALISYTITNGCGSNTDTAMMNVLATPGAAISAAIVPCYGYGTSVVFTGTAGDTINYEVDGVPHRDVLSGGSFTITVPSLTSAHTYHLSTVNNAACATTIDTAITLSPTQMTWTGAADTNWHNGANWSCGTVPTATDNIIIPAGTPHEPWVLVFATANANNVSIDTGAAILVDTFAVFHIKGSLQNNGRITGAGTALLDGTAPQDISGLGFIANATLSNTGGATIVSGARMVVGNVLNITTGNLTTGDSLVLGADTLGSTARLALLGSGATVTGKARVMQYIRSGYRRYRFMAHPFSDTISFSQLQTYVDITGTGGVANGFTATVTNSPSAYRYNTLIGNSTLGYDPGWRPITSALATAADSDRLHPYQGIRIYLRGAKGEGLGYGTYIPSATIAGQFGNLNQGAQYVILQKGSSTGQDYNFLGNPYASPVDIGTVIYNAKRAGKVIGAFYIWEPTLGAGGQFIPFPVDTSLSVMPYVIQANVGYEVRAAHNGDTLLFNESNKATTPSATLLRTADGYTTLHVYDASYHLWDMLRIQFADKATGNQDDAYDADKLMGGDLNFYSMSSDKKRQAIDVRPYQEGQIIPLGITSNYAQDFIIRAEKVSLPDAASLFLHDKLMDTYVSLQDGIEYRFSITKDAATQGNDRFELSMKPGTEAKMDFTSTISPNPASNEVNISYSNNKAKELSIRIISMTGVTVYSRQLPGQENGNVTVPVGKYAAGLYTVELTSGGSKVVKRMVKE